MPLTALPYTITLRVQLHATLLRKLHANNHFHGTVKQLYQPGAFPAPFTLGDAIKNVVTTVPAYTLFVLIAMSTSLC